MRISDWSSDVCSSDLPLASRSPSSNTQILRSAIRLTPDRISPTRRITMRLYLTSTGEWTGNQSDAAGLVRANGGTWEQIDVPTDKPGLIAWLPQQWTRFPTIAAPSAPITRAEAHTSEPQ